MMAACMSPSEQPGCALLRRKEQGFAYIWVLLAVAFMGVGLTVAVDLHASAVQRDKEAELLAIGHQFRSAIGRYYETQASGSDNMPGRKAYPASLDDLLRDSRYPDIKRHLRQVFVDPMTGKAEWGLMRIGGRIVGVYSLSQHKPIKQEGFEADDMNFRIKDHYSDWVFTYPSDLLLRPDQQKDSPAVAEPSQGSTSTDQDGGSS
jgi:type II secretory pathway pseudopilin PulG